MTTSTFTTTHIRVQTEKQFGEVTKDFERQLGKFDPTVFQALRPDAERADDARARIEAMAGSSGFMLFGTTDHGALLSIFGVKKNAIQYVVGNPLIAIQMTRHNLAAGLYGCDPKMGLRCISLRLLTCGYVRHLLVVRIAQNAVDFSVFKGVGSQILGDRRLA